jgi:hypothetical protein
MYVMFRFLLREKQFTPKSIVQIFDSSYERINVHEIYIALNTDSCALELSYNYQH